MAKTPLQRQWLRKAIYARDNYRCRYCGCVTTEHTEADNMRTLDHVIPVDMGGRYTYVNLVTACKSCNGHKSNRTLREVGMVMRPIPQHGKIRTDLWHPTILMNRCMNCGRGSKSSHEPAAYHGGPKKCRYGDSYYLSPAHHEWLESQGLDTDVRAYYARREAKGTS